MDTARFKQCRDKVVENVSKVIVGKNDIITLALVAFVCSGHVLLEDVPGTGKTMLLRAFAKTMGGGFTRVQFTPDLLPSDLTGIHFYNQKTSDFEFRPGPLFSNMVLGDEINRATPRTQSAMLEAMGEGQITVDGVTMKLDEPFMVMATQNPIESYGTFPLPEAQLDRFMMRLSLGRISRDEEREVIARASTIDLVESLAQQLATDDINFVKTEYLKVTVRNDVVNYLLDIVEKTRTSVTEGVSTRGAGLLYKGAQALAACNGRDFVLPEDVKFLADPILRHRLPATTDYSFRSLVDSVTVPLEAV